MGSWIATAARPTPAVRSASRRRPLIDVPRSGSRTDHARVLEARHLARAARPALGRRGEHDRHLAAGEGAQVRVERDPRALDADRSEEHTSELQSRLHLVCRLLLEKKKKKKVQDKQTHRLL